MAGLGFQRKKRSPVEIFSAPLVSLFLFIFSQFSLAMVPRLLSSISMVEMLPISGLVVLGTIGLGRVLKRMLGVSGSAPAMVVFHVLFFWGVYIAVIREAIPSLLDAIVNAECALLLFGLYRILSSDPGMVTYDSSSAIPELNSFHEANLQCEISPPFSRVRYCKICKTSVRGFDHHCSAFGNCIGYKNHRLFMLLLVGFIIAEASYTMSSTQYITKSIKAGKVGLENNLSGNLVISTLLFSVVQLLWQVFFLMWSVYCICFNITTDEWINWRRYPEFQLSILNSNSQPGNYAETRFSNPYNKGILGNIRDFLRPVESRLLL